jgi:hypothetical protein
VSVDDEAQMPEVAESILRSSSSSSDGAKHRQASAHSGSEKAPKLTAFRSDSDMDSEKKSSDSENSRGSDSELRDSDHDRRILPDDNSEDAEFENDDEGKKSGEFQSTNSEPSLLKMPARIDALLVRTKGGLDGGTSACCLLL